MESNFTNSTFNHDFSETLISGYIFLGLCGLCICCGSIACICQSNKRGTTRRNRINFNIENQCFDLVEKTRALELGSIQKIENINETEVCSICLEPFDSSTINFYVLKCGHKYHQHCWKDWSKVKESCPVCRFDGNLVS